MGFVTDSDDNTSKCHRYAKDGSPQHSYSAKREGTRPRESNNKKEGRQNSAQLKAEMANIKAKIERHRARSASKEHLARSATLWNMTALTPNRMMGSAAKAMKQSTLRVEMKCLKIDILDCCSIIVHIACR